MDPFIGEVRAFAFNYPPEGWIVCDGSLVPLAQQQTLYSIIGTTFGGDGRQTFKVPNLCGTAVMGQGAAPGLSPAPWGLRSGAEGISLVEDQLPSHDHTVTGRLTTDPTQMTATPGPDVGLSRGYVLSSPAAPVRVYSRQDEVNTTLSPQAIGTTGQSQPHENRQPFLTVLYCIASDGVYPTRP